MLGATSVTPRAVQNWGLLGVYGLAYTHLMEILEQCRKLLFRQEGNVSEVGIISQDG